MLRTAVLCVAWAGVAAAAQLPLPADWRVRKAAGWLLAGTTEPVVSDLCPTYGNGFVAATICPAKAGEAKENLNGGGVFLSGVYVIRAIHLWIVPSHPCLWNSKGHAVLVCGNVEQRRVYLKYLDLI